MRRVKALLMVVGGMVVGATLWDLLGPGEPTAEAPPVERIAVESAPPRQVVGADDLLAWGRAKTPIAVVDTARDALPNGLALSMASLLVDWKASELAGDEPFAIVRNVSVGGNPVLGTNVLGTVRVPLTGITDAQWCLVLDRTAGGRDTAMGHAQLRFTFALAARPEVLGLGGAPLAVPARLDDLILSWEAWRPPNMPYDPIAGLDPEAYALTVRAYSGAQRFLTDALRRSPWECYPLALPETGSARSTLLGISLAWGDSLMRRILQAMAERGEIDRSEVATLVEDFSADDRAQLRAVFAATDVPADPVFAVLGETDLSYQLLERSCITQSFTAIQWALDRIHATHALGPPPEIDIVPAGLPDWMRDLSIDDRGELLGKLPGAIVYVAKHRSVLPGEAWRVLDDAGVLERNGAGKPVKYYYFVDDETPYGRLRQNMM